MSTCPIAIFVYENGHACVTARPFDSSFRIAICISHISIFWGKGSHNLYVRGCDMWFLEYIPFGLEAAPRDFFLYDLPICCLLLCVCLQCFWSQIYLFVAKDRRQLEFSDISDVPFSPLSKCGKYCCVYNAWLPAAKCYWCALCCLSESMPRTGSKILWRDFQLGKCKAAWCSKSFKTLHPWTASATPHCRISQSFPRCTEWVVSFLSQLRRIAVQWIASLP